MNKFFRKIRLKSLKEAKNISYLKYAFGEILLVVIGILLALQINNWNENRKQEYQLQNILKTIHEDLKTDTLSAKIIIDYYKEVEETSEKIINGEITKENYKNFPNARSLTSRYRPFVIQTKGFEMVKDFSSKNEMKNDSIFIQISQFYTPFMQLFEDSNEFIKNEVLKNIETYKKHDWFIDWSQGKSNDEMMMYFTESKEYKIQVAAHNLLAVKNHLKFITGYKDGALDIMKSIEKQIQNKK